MRRVLLLTLFALALPTSTLANSFTFNSADFQSGSVSGGLAGLSVTVIGTNFKVLLLTGPLTADSTCSVSGSTCYSWPTGTGMVEVFSPSNTLLFQDTLKGGTIATTGVINPTNFLCLPSSCAFSVAAGLEPSNQLDEGSTAFSIVIENAAAGILNAGGGTVTFQRVPEPGRLEQLLLGTGVIGLAEMARRKLIPAT